MLSSPLPTVDFGPEQAAPIQCSRHECENGHKWPIKLALINCPGCGGQMFALMMVQCPICNEPTKLTAIRMDHLAQGGGIMPICKGSATLAESITIQMDHAHATQEQARYIEREVISKP
jgi:hypothetical protein